MVVLKFIIIFILKLTPRVRKEARKLAGQVMPRFWCDYCAVHLTHDSVRI